MKRALCPAFVGAALLFSCAATVPSALAQADRAASATRESRVTYLAGASIYIAAGSAEGVAVGDQVEVLKDGQVVAVLRVTYTSEHRATAERVSGAEVIDVGALVRYTPHAVQPAPAGAAAAAAAAAAAPTGETTTARRASPSGIHGRVGLRYMAVSQRGESQVEYTQPSIDLRINGSDMFGGPLDLYVDVRARRTNRTLYDGSSDDESRSMVYGANLAWQQRNSPVRVSLGRQFSPSLAVVNIFDGLMVEYRKDGWGTGIFGGSQPDAEDFGLSGDIREYGGFVEFTNKGASNQRWGVSTGVAASYQDGEINREFVFVQGRYDNRKFSFFGTQEIDVNRDWRKTAEGESFSFTSTYIALRYRFGQDFSINGGFDNRRNARLYRDIVTPETDFDDRYRRGYWGGFDGAAGRHFYYGVNARFSTLEDAEDAPGDEATSYSLLLGVRRLTKLDLDIRSRTTSYTNDYVEGWLESLSCGLNLGDRSRLDVHFGLRDETGVASNTFDEQLTWYGLDWGVQLSRRWLATLSAERNDGDIEKYDQYYATLAYRF